LAGVAYFGGETFSFFGSTTGLASDASTSSISFGFLRAPVALVVAFEDYSAVTPGFNDFGLARSSLILSPSLNKNG